MTAAPITCRVWRAVCAADETIDLVLLCEKHDWLLMVCCLRTIDPHLPQPGSAQWRACRALARLAFTRCGLCVTPAASLTGGRFSCSLTHQDRLLLRPTPTVHPAARHMQKGRPQKLKVRPITTIERAPSLTPRLLTP